MLLQMQNFGRLVGVQTRTSVRCHHVSNCNKPERPQNDFFDTGCVQCLTGLLSWAVFWLLVNIVTDVPDPGAVSAEWPLAALSHCVLPNIYLLLWHMLFTLFAFKWAFCFTFSIFLFLFLLTSSECSKSDCLCRERCQRSQCTAWVTELASQMVSHVGPNGWLDLCLGLSSKNYLESKVTLVINWFTIVIWQGVFFRVLMDRVKKIITSVGF